MSCSVKECYDWGVLGCGWLGQAFARQILQAGGTVWGSAKSTATLDAIAQTGATAVAFDALDSQTVEFPDCKHLLVAWPPTVGHAAAKVIELGQSNRTEWTVCISSTSVYPEHPGVFTEDLAERRISPHSGICVLDIEMATEGPSVTQLRAGGLIGPQRPLFRKTNRPVNLDKPLNVVHLEDVISAIGHCANHRIQGPVNLVSPVRRTRLDCQEVAKNAMSHTASEASTDQGMRAVSSQRLLDSGFVFQHPDPAFFPNLQP